MIHESWQHIQHSLFPHLEECLGPLTEKEKQVVATLELLNIEKHISVIPRATGRPPKYRLALARSFVAKPILGLSTTEALIDRLMSSPNLRWICGFNGLDKIPSVSTFSRAFAEFGNLKLAEKIHESLIKNIYDSKLVGHLSRDSSAIEVRERLDPEYVNRDKEKKKESKLGAQLEQSLEKSLEDLKCICSYGCKRNSKGFRQFWRGYKLHLDVADGQIPISCLLTSANIHDSQTAIPLSKMSEERVEALYELMDSAYDAKEIRGYVSEKGRVAIIESNSRSRNKKAPTFCPAQKQKFKERTAVERVFGRLKDQYGLNSIRVRGAAKVMSHVMFGVIALTADQLLKMVT